ncbi:acyltransferase family protein [Bradyrhizobium sp. 83012]|uniref:Acyltransferase family protein n=1 Tax=Bradyrhizobium aeschynomenes TaxID=2734909 RepID=A0ABX2CNF0_9BRAD|nr:acyltransferase family protein [Bradyrhizobium aeschynomenes]NPU68797.1 acyltransferase family protein [Bradyrhizobium aeschynomenes]
MHAPAQPCVAGSSAASAPAHREDVDWLRAIAVLAVIGFHFEAPAIFGGFVGVDIFFVISGYLITGIITAEIAKGQFSFANFYERRVRRLLPALYVMVAFAAIPAFWDMLSSERAELSRSAMAVVTFTSNIFFWQQSGYFDHAAVEKPLLHTWSLAVEEQFYLVLPLVVWAVLRCSRGRGLVLPVTLVLLAASSFGLGLVLMRDGGSAGAFFLSPPRAWEFLLGSLVAVSRLPAPRPGLVQRAARTLALVLMAIPILSLRPGAGFPGVNALAPCLGAALFLWSGTGVANVPRSRMSPLRVAAFIGRISYSLYLWHWPLFVFARFAKPGLALDGWERAALFTLTVAIATLSWRHVEQPFRNRRLAATPRAAFGLAALASLALLLGSGAGLLRAGVTSDTDRAAQRLDAYNSYDIKPVYRYGSCFTTPDGRVPDDCLRHVDGKANVLLWGDSYAAHYYHGLKVQLDPDSVNIMQASQPTCMPTFSAETQGVAACRALASQMRDYLASNRPDLVVMSADWLEDARPPRFAGMVRDLRQTLRRLNDRGIPVVLLGPSVQFRARLPSMLARAMLRGVTPDPAVFVRSDIFALDQAMQAALPAGEGFSYVSILTAACEDRVCPLMANNVPLSFDHAHLTAEGSARLMAKVAPNLLPDVSELSSNQRVDHRARQAGHEGTRDD